MATKLRVGVRLLSAAGIPFLLTSGGCGSSQTEPTPVYWSLVRSPTNQHLHAIDAVSATDVWVAGDYGNFVHFDGKKWSIQLAAFVNDIYCIDMVDANHGWAGGGGGIVYHYDGSEWKRLEQGQTVCTLFACHFTSYKKGWFVGDNGTILQYDDGSWTLHENPLKQPLTGVYVPPGGDGWACRQG
jgi:photosystem II stability/assembly factor-like uncharacterized protein